MIDWDFIHTLEGYVLNGYVPKDSDKKNTVQSGVTVCCGFDLGQQSSLVIGALDIPETIQRKLMPYVGLKGDVAKKTLKNNPLSLTSTEGELLNKAVRSKYTDALIKEYNTASPVSFDNLDTGQKTVLMSVAFQYGSLKKRTPNFWKSVTTQDWEKAYKQLCNFHDSYSTRRRKEAEFLKKHSKSVTTGV